MNNDKLARLKEPDGGCALGEQVRRMTTKEALTSLHMAVVVGLAMVSVPFALVFLPTIKGASVGLPLFFVFAAAVQFWVAVNDPALVGRVIDELIPRQSDSSRLRAEIGQAGLARGVEQLDALDEKFDNLLEMLKRRFNRGEFTYARSLGVGKEVYFLVCDNLRAASDQMVSVSTIDREALLERIE